MTVRSPLFIGSVSHAEGDVRLGLTALFGLPTTSMTRPSGVIPGYGGTLAVTQASSPAMSVQVASGGVHVGGTVSPTQGNYMLINDAAVNLAITSSHPTLPRVDVVVARIKDDDYGDPLLSVGGYLEVVTGTPNATRTAPATPANAVKLAEVDVAANSTAVLTSNVTDFRSWSAAVGSVLPCKSTNRPQFPHDGMYIHETDTGLLQVFSGGIWTHPIFGASRSVTSSDSGSFTSGSTSYTHLSGGGTPVGIGVAFQVPRSGLVTCLWRIRMTNSVATNSCLVSAETRTGATIGSGTVVEAASDEWAAGYTGDSSRADRPVGLHVPSGLTPGGWYNVRLLHRVTAGTGTFDDRFLVVMPSM